MLRLVLVILLLIVRGAGARIIIEKRVRELVRAWAPLVWLAPGEKFLPLGVPEFLDNVKAGNNHLHTRVDLESLLRNESSFIYGKEPSGNVPIYALVKNCAMSAIDPTASSSTASKKTKLSLSLSPVYAASNEITNTNNGDHEMASDAMKRAGIIRSDVATDMTGTRSPTRRAFAKRQRRRRVASTSDGEKGSRGDFVPRKLLLGKEQSQHRRTLSNELSGNRVVATRDAAADAADTIRRGNSIPANVATDNRFRKLHFHVTYWMFYPFSEGKAVCVLDLGYFGSWPIPIVGGRCLGSLREYGNHVGDWEHMSLYFKDDVHPTSMYVSAHDAGAFYRYEKRSGTFVYEGQETRKGIFQKPIFPERVFTSTGKHPVLFSARGSHGLWTAPGKHKFVRLPRLYDESGFGIAWPTWKRIELLPENVDDDGSPAWMSFRGKWGNPRNNCHPLVKLGFDICEYVDGPTGIPTKKGRFQCSL